MQTLKLIFKRLWMPLFVLINAYCLTNLLTGGTYCQHFRLNGSKSLPFYLFAAAPIESLEREMYVSLYHPLLSSRDIFKQIVGMPGDQISIRNQHLFINNRDYGYIYQIAPSGLKLSAIPERVMCDRYVVKLEGESPLRTLVRRTVREGKGVHREVKSEESCIQNADLTNRKCI